MSFLASRSHDWVAWQIEEQCRHTFQLELSGGRRFESNERLNLLLRCPGESPEVSRQSLNDAPANVSPSALVQEALARARAAESLPLPPLKDQIAPGESCRFWEEAQGLLWLEQLRAEVSKLQPNAPQNLRLRAQVTRVRVRNSRGLQSESFYNKIEALVGNKILCCTAQTDLIYVGLGIVKNL